MNAIRSLWCWLRYGHLWTNDGGICMRCYLLRGDAR